MKVLFKKIFAIEGNIGAGKSTLLSKLENEIPNCKVIYEPVDEWKNIGGSDLLKAFYTDPKRWAFTFELESMVSKVRKIKEAISTNVDVILMERSIFSDKIFQVTSFYYDKTSGLEMQLLDDIRKDLMKDYPHLSGVIYVDTDPSTCLERIKSRGRTEEYCVTKDYLEKLEDGFLSTKYGCPMAMIDGNYDSKDAKKTINMVLKFINKCV